MKFLTEPFLGIVVFSAVETAAVVAWGALLGVGDGFSLNAKLLAGGVLFVGYVVEHVVAFNVGKDRAYLQFPRR